MLDVFNDFIYASLTDFTHNVMPYYTRLHTVHKVILSVHLFHLLLLDIYLYICNCYVMVRPTEKTIIIAMKTDVCVMYLLG